MRPSPISTSSIHRSAPRPPARISSCPEPLTSRLVPILQNPDGAPRPRCNSSRRSPNQILRSVDHYACFVERPPPGNFTKSASLTCVDEPKGCSGATTSLRPQRAPESRPRLVQPAGPARAVKAPSPASDARLIRRCASPRNLLASQSPSDGWVAPTLRSPAGKSVCTQKETVRIKSPMLRLVHESVMPVCVQIPCAL